MTLQEKMLAVMADVNDHIMEREELVELIAIALLTRKNLFVLGEPGQAKSYAINLFRDRITDCVQFERLLSKQSDEEQLFGRIDLQSIIPGSVPQSVLQQDVTYGNMVADLEGLHRSLQQPTADQDTLDQATTCAENLEAYRKILAAIHQGQPQMITTGKIPEAHIAFVDEIFKCNDGVLNSLLTALNERKYTNEGKTYPIPTISFFAASNEIPNFDDPAEKILEALYDRLELKLVTENIAEQSNRLAMMATKQQGHTMFIGHIITLDELYAMEQEVAKITVPEAINQLADDICCELKLAGIQISDRKLLNYAPIAQAKAWLSGNSCVTSPDLLALRHYLWKKPTERQKINATLERLCINPLQDKVNTIRGMAAEVAEQFHDSLAGHEDDRKKASKLLYKFRGEFVRLYRKYLELTEETQNDSEKALVETLLQDLEKINEAVHQQVGFTYTPLEQLNLMQ